MTKTLPLFALLILASTALAQETSVTIAEEKTTLAPTTTEWVLDVPPFSIEHQVRLSLECRIDWPKLSGSNPWMFVYVNDTAITDEHLLNKTPEFVLLGGIDLTWYKGSRWRVLYSPDFEAAVAENAGDYGCYPKDEPYRFVWDITSLVTPGADNKLKIQHVKVLQDPSTMVMRNVKIEVGKFIDPVREVEEIVPAPLGPLTVIAPTGAQPVNMAVRVSRAGVIDVNAAGETFTTRTRVSLPAGKWQEADNASERRTIRQGASATVSWTAGDVNIERTIAHHDDYVHVTDKLTNTSDELVGVIIEHRTTGSAAPQDIRLAGKQQRSPVGVAREPMNPAVYANLGKAGVGLVAVDDIMRVHSTIRYDAEGISLADDRLGIPAGASHTLEWSIYPTEGDYWSFVNAVRRNWGSNYEIPGPFVFNGYLDREADPVRWMHERDVRMVCGGIAKYPDGKYAHGSGICFAPAYVEANRKWTQAMRERAPELIPMQYFHVFCSTEPDARTKYHDARMLEPDGTHIEYPYSYPLPLYVPTLENSYGKHGQGIWTYADTLIDDIGVKGIYWDEFAYSVTQYVPADSIGWDGCSVQIDPNTHTITGKTTSVSLITQPLKLELVDYIRDEHGLMLTANGQPFTRTMLDKHIPRFVETNTYSALDATHLGCPLGLGNHHPEDTHAQAAEHVREFLKRGATYHGHYYHRDAADWNFVEDMYPITPAQIGPGYLIGEQRIHTTVPGRFSFPDGSQAANMYTVNGDGLEGADDMITEVVEDGRYAYDVRIPSDHFAVLVKK
jgi:hypothetical protein